MRRFLDEVDPLRALPEAERNRRAERARKAYFTKLAYLSSRARSQRRQAEGLASPSTTDQRVAGTDLEAVMGHWPSRRDASLMTTDPLAE
jgi:diacylglycerol kinase family enzyme